MARALTCASQRNVRAIDTIQQATVISAFSVIAPNTSNQESIITKNEIFMHFEHIPI